MSLNTASDTARYFFTSSAEALFDVPLHVARFSGTEGLNQLFAFTITLLSPRNDVDTEALLNAPAELQILRDDAPPAIFSGYPTRVEQGGTFHGYTYYTVELRPAFWKCTHIRQSSIFLNSDLKKTVKELLTAQEFFSFAHSFRFMRSDYPVQEFAMQYDESVYDYICRRLEDQGAYFYFDEQGSLIFADHPQSHSDAPHGERLRYAPLSNLEGAHVPETILDFRMMQTPLPRRVVIRSYDWKDPKHAITGFADVSKQGLGDVYLPHEAVFTDKEATRLAKIRAEELQCRARLFHGTSAVPSLRPGYVFTLYDHPAQQFNTRYLVTEITHEGAQETFLSLGLGIVLQESEDHLFYRNSFTCIAADLPYRPARTAPRAKVEGSLHAFIDGAGSGARPELDKYGRYKVIFPFDVSGRSAGKASCWVRMAQPQVGRHSGMSMPLRPGVEVLITFIDGNPDLPVITGALPNGETGALTASGNPNFSGIRTAGGNQISFGDSDKHQGMAFHTPDGHGLTMGAGSLPAMTTNTGTALSACEQGGASIATFGNSMLSSYSASLAACPDTGKAFWLALLAQLPTLFTSIASVCEQNAADDKVKTGLQHSIGLTKFLVPLIEVALKNRSSKRDKKIASGNKTPYGVIISSDEDGSKASMRALPKSTKEFWLMTFLPIVLGKATQLGTRLAAKSPQIQEKQAKETYKTAWQYAQKAACDAKAALQNAVKMAETELQNAETEQEKENAKKKKETAEAAFKKAEEATIPTAISNPACSDYAALNTALTKLKVAFLESTVSDKNAQIENLATKQSDLKKAYSAYCNEDTKDVQEKYKNPTAAETSYAYLTSGMADLVAEIVATAITCYCTTATSAKKLGGVILSAPDSNINMVAQAPISAQSEIGVIINTLATNDSATRQDAAKNLYNAYKDVTNTTVDSVRNFIGAPKLGNTVQPTDFANTTFLAGDKELTKQDNSALIAPHEVDAAQKTYIAHITDVAYTAAQYNYTSITSDNIVSAKRHGLYTPDGNCRISLHAADIATTSDANKEPMAASIALVAESADTQTNNKKILLRAFKKATIAERTDVTIQQNSLSMQSQTADTAYGKSELTPKQISHAVQKDANNTCSVTLKDDPTISIEQKIKGETGGSIKIDNWGNMKIMPASTRRVQICNFSITDKEMKATVTGNLKFEGGKITIG